MRALQEVEARLPGGGQGDVGAVLAAMIADRPENCPNQQGVQHRRIPYFALVLVRVLAIPLPWREQER